MDNYNVYLSMNDDIDSGIDINKKKKSKMLYSM